VSPLKTTVKASVHSGTVWRLDFCSTLTTKRVKDKPVKVIHLGLVCNLGLFGIILTGDAAVSLPPLLPPTFQIKNMEDVVASGGERTMAFYPSVPKNKIIWTKETLEIQDSEDVLLQSEPRLLVFNPSSIDQLRLDAELLEDSKKGNPPVLSGPHSFSGFAITAIKKQAKNGNAYHDVVN
jgi:hypothetical protein